MILHPIRTALVLGAGIAMALVPMSTATAAWSVAATGSGSSAAAVMPTGTAPVATVTGTSVIVSWTAADLSSGTAVSGYTIHRYKAGTLTSASVGSACSGAIATLSCTENAVTAGTWVYTDTPVENNWTGGQSPDSTSVTVP